MGNLSVVLGDVTKQSVDVIVNAANGRMRGGGGVDGAIHRAGGRSILDECIEKYPDGVATGEVGVTGAGNLDASWVVHAVGPNYKAGQTNPALLASCYEKAIAAAEERGARSMAFPLISAGIYGWPVTDAAEIAVSTIVHSSTTIADIRLVAFSENDYEALQQAVSRHTQ